MVERLVIVCSKKFVDKLMVDRLVAVYGREIGIGREIVIGRDW